MKTLLIILLLAVPVYSQTQTPVTQDKVLLEAESEARILEPVPDKPNPNKKVVEIYDKALRDAAQALSLLARELEQLNRGRRNAKSTPEATRVAAEVNVNLTLLTALQNQTIIEQNKKIIELLEHLVNNSQPTKKPATK